QYDNFSIPTDGLAIDDISITGQPTRRLVVRVPKETTEGDGTLRNQGRVSLLTPPMADLLIKLSSSDTSKVTVPATVTLPAGAMQATFDLFIQDNSLLDGTQTATIDAEATGYFGQSDTIAVHDNEQASLRVRLPRGASEADGILPQAGLVTASSKPDRDVLVNLASSQPND